MKKIFIGIECLLLFLPIYYAHKIVMFCRNNKNYDLHVMKSAQLTSYL